MACEPDETVAGRALFLRLPLSTPLYGCNSHQQPDHAVIWTTGLVADPIAFGFTMEFLQDTAYSLCMS